MDLLAKGGGEAKLRSDNMFHVGSRFLLTNNSNHANAYHASYGKR